MKASQFTKVGELKNWITTDPYQYYQYSKTLKNYCIKDYDFLQENNILFQNHFGFHKNNSTTFKRCGCGIFIDLKVVDTVYHEILLRKLEMLKFGSDLT